MPLECFLELFKRALCKVDLSFYQKEWRKDDILSRYNLPIGDPKRDKLENFLTRYDERVFCYELYHQVRLLMDETGYTIDNQNLFFQAELKKFSIEELAEYFPESIETLDKEYVPDFLLHHPLRFDEQELIIEVKTNPHLSFSGIKSDL